MSKHTKGPWRFESFGPPDGFQPFGGCGCCGSPWMNGGSTEVEDANARLIVAAPELYEALREVEGALREVDYTRHNLNFTSAASQMEAVIEAAGRLAVARESARAALSKVEGE